MTVLAIDPGVKNLGWAISRDGILFACGNSRTSKKDLVAAACDHRMAIWDAMPLPARSSLNDLVKVYLESMVTRDGAYGQDVLDVQTVGCLTASAVAGEGGDIGFVSLHTPDSWKGTIPKSVHHKRLVDALSPGEQHIVICACQKAGRNAKEVMDAVGLLLFATQRITRSGVRT